MDRWSVNNIPFTDDFLIQSVVEEDIQKVAKGLYPLQKPLRGVMSALFLEPSSVRAKRIN
ncbi:MAG: hypothetical protein OXE77_06855 [Flavobacteriaceae bacterium]|nr:hypothetical protein [Flavobacteriaceae bacterium]MCY4267518.1 hypothetical protein [Flavobacteriaceae bacterium]MCY4299704.1 hypothetical protein [Flavobacteriaceae bacterium]